MYGFQSFLDSKVVDKEFWTVHRIFLKINLAT